MQAIDGDYATVEEMAVSYTNNGDNTNAAKNRLTYRGYYHDKDLDMYYLKSRYYDPAISRFISADGYVSTGTGLLGYNMYAYCNNNPVMYVDPEGCMLDYNATPDTPAAAVGAFIGNLIYSLGLYWYEHDKEIEKNLNYDVKYSNDGNITGARIENSYQVTNPLVMYEHINENRDKEVSGTSTGVVFEWMLHNAAYFYYSGLGNVEKANQAKDVDIGKTIFDDYEHGWQSLGMKMAYFITRPITAICDFVIYCFD